MTTRHIAEYFQKSTTKPNNVLTEIWHDNEVDHLNVINDFVHHKSHNTMNLSVQEVRRIRKINSKQSLRKSPYIKELELDIKCSNMFKQNVKLQNVSTNRTEVDWPMFISPWTPDTLIPDNLLDTFDIPTGNNSERLNRFYKNSEVIYHYLCYCIGSERIVKLRRWLLRKKVLKNPGNGLILEVIGSKAEGLDMKGSDIDIMVIVDSLGVAYENSAVSTQNRGTTWIQYKSSDLFPGYVLVELVSNGKYTSMTNSLFKDWLTRLISDNKLLFKTTAHGPALSQSSAGDDMDFVPTIRSNTWPDIAKEWIERERKFGWPSQEMINSIVKQGCCIVPVGIKAKQDSNREWRLSFSLAEKDLIFSFNHTQLLVYGLFKIILKEVVNANKEVSDLICSYFLKTVLFWTIEETPSIVWKPQFFILCFHLCLQRLIQFIAEVNCPNYFARINNMFAGRFLNYGKEKLLQIFCDISVKGLNWIPQSETMNKLRYFIQDPSNLMHLRGLRKRKDLIAIVENVLDLIRFSKTLSLYAFALKKEMPILWLKSLYKVPIVRRYLRADVCHYINTQRMSDDNKKVNRLQKLHLLLLCSGCNNDLAAGKLILASWLYKNEKFIEGLEFADMALKFTQYRILHAGIQTTTESQSSFIYKFDNESEVDLIQNLLRLSTADVIFFHNSCLLLDEIKSVESAMRCTLTAFNPNIFPQFFFPEYFSHFLRFLCLFKLGKTKYSQDALIEMQHVKPIGSKYEQMAHSVLATTLQIAGNIVLNRTEYQRRNHTNNVVDAFEYLSADNSEGVNYFACMTVIKHWEEFGVDPSIFIHMLPLVMSSFFN